MKWAPSFPLSFQSTTSRLAIGCGYFTSKSFYIVDVFRQGINTGDMNPYVRENDEIGLWFFFQF